MPLRSKCANRTLYGVLGLVCLTVVVVFVVPPLFLLWLPGMMGSFKFSNIKGEEIPQFVDYDHPEKVGFVGAQNFYVMSSGGAKIGVWHTLPSDLESAAGKLTQADVDSTYREWMSNATVFLYLHGSAGTRTSSHRQRVYRLLNRVNYHVVALDYRGFGDSTGVAKNETDLVEDAKAVYSWIKEGVTSGHIFLWGHSLGAGVAAHLADLLVGLGEPISGIVLEAPFYNMAEADVRADHLDKIVTPVPCFDNCCFDPLYDKGLAFSSDKHLSNIATPVLILHAKDDEYIPFEQSVQLRETVISSRQDPTSVQLITYDSSLHYGHCNISLEPNLSATIRHFVDKQLHLDAQ